MSQTGLKSCQHNPAILVGGVSRSDQFCFCSGTSHHFFAGLEIVNSMILFFLLGNLTCIAYFILTSLHAGKARNVSSKIWRNHQCCCYYLYTCILFFSFYLLVSVLILSSMFLWLNLPLDVGFFEDLLLFCCC